MAEIGTVMAAKAAIVTAGIGLAGVYKAWSVSYLQRNRRPEDPTDIRPVAYFLGRSLRRLALAAKSKLLNHGVDTR